MNNLTFTVAKSVTGLIASITLAIGLAVSMTVMAKGMSEDQYKLLDNEYKVAKIRCTSLSGVDKDICEKSAKVVKAKRIENANTQKRMSLPKKKVLANEMPAYSNSMTVIEELSSTHKKSRSM